MYYLYNSVFLLFINSIPTTYVFLIDLFEIGTKYQTSYILIYDIGHSLSILYPAVK